MMPFVRYRLRNGGVISLSTLRTEHKYGRIPVRTYAAGRRVSQPPPPPSFRAKKATSAKSAVDPTGISKRNGADSRSTTETLGNGQPRKNVVQDEVDSGSKNLTSAKNGSSESSNSYAAGEGSTEKESNHVNNMSSHSTTSATGSLSSLLSSANSATATSSPYSTLHREDRLANALFSIPSAGATRNPEDTANSSNVNPSFSFGDMVNSGVNQHADKGELKTSSNEETDNTATKAARKEQDSEASKDTQRQPQQKRKVPTIYTTHGFKIDPVMLPSMIAYSDKANERMDAEPSEQNEKIDYTSKESPEIGDQESKSTSIPSNSSTSKSTGFFTNLISKFLGTGHPKKSHKEHQGYIESQTSNDATSTVEGEEYDGFPDLPLNRTMTREEHMQRMVKERVDDEDEIYDNEWNKSKKSPPPPFKYSKNFDADQHLSELEDVNREPNYIKPPTECSPRDIVESGGFIVDKKYGVISKEEKYNLLVAERESMLLDNDRNRYGITQELSDAGYPYYGYKADPSDTFTRRMKKYRFSTSNKNNFTVTGEDVMRDLAKIGFKHDGTNDKKSKMNFTSEEPPQTIPNYMTTIGAHEVDGTLLKHQHSLSRAFLADVDSKINSGLNINKNVIESVRNTDEREFLKSSVSSQELWRAIALMNASPVAESKLAMDGILTQLKSASDVFTGRNFVNRTKKLRSLVKIRVQNESSTATPPSGIVNASGKSLYTAKPSSFRVMRDDINLEPNAYISSLISKSLRRRGVVAKTTPEYEVFLVEDEETLETVLDVVNPYFEFQDLDKLMGRKTSSDSDNNYGTKQQPESKIINNTKLPPLHQQQLQQQNDQQRSINSDDIGLPETPLRVSNDGKLCRPLSVIGFDIEKVDIGEELKSVPCIMQIAITEEIVVIIHLINMVGINKIIADMATKAAEAAKVVNNSTATPESDNSDPDKPEQVSTTAIVDSKSLNSRVYGALKKSSRGNLKNLINFVSNPTIIKTGVGVGHDCGMLCKYYGFKFSDVGNAGVIPLEELYANMGLPQRSLKDIVDSLNLDSSYKNLAKGSGSWSDPLAQQASSRLVYAAEDARVGLLAFNILQIPNLDSVIPSYLDICDNINRFVYYKFLPRDLPKVQTRLSEISPGAAQSNGGAIADSNLLKILQE